MHKRVAIYVRVSSKDQVDDGFGLQYQKRDLLELVRYKSKTHNWFTTDDLLFIDEGISGSSTDRPAFKRLMHAVKSNKVDIVAVWKIDRFSRSLSDLLNSVEVLQKHNTAFYSLKEGIDFSGAMGKLSLQLLGAIGEFESSNIKSRTASGRLESALNGNFPGRNVAYGYARILTENGARLRIIEAEEKWVRAIYDWFARDKMTYSGIAKRLNDLSIPKGKSAPKASKNAPWAAQHIRGILRNSTYAGEYKTSIKNADGQPQNVRIPTPSIIDKARFEAAQRRIEAIKNKNKTKGRSTPKYLLSHKMYDVDTGKRFVGYQRSKDDQISYRRKKHVAENGLVFRNRELPAKPIEAFVKGIILDIVCTPQLMFEQYKKQHTKGENREELVKNRDAILQEIEQLNATENRILEDYFEGNLTAETRAKLLEKATMKREILEQKQAEITEDLYRIADVNSTLKTFTEFSKSLSDKLENATTEEWKQLVQLLLNRIDVGVEDNEYSVTAWFEFDPDSGNRVRQQIEPLEGQDHAINGSPNGGFVSCGAKEPYRSGLICFKGRVFSAGKYGKKRIVFA